MTIHGDQELFSDAVGSCEINIIKEGYMVVLRITATDLPTLKIEKSDSK